MTTATSLQRARKRFGSLESRINYRFKDHANIERALTHSSLRKRSDDFFHYERLEFLGDRVLGLIVADMLYENFPDANEGELSLRLNALVKGNMLAQIADELNLHEFIRTGSDIKELTGKRMQNVRADVLEALIASIFLDGGLPAATEFIDRFWGTRLFDETTARRDSKTELQEWAHAKKQGTPRYKEISRSGPDHEPIFKVQVQVGELTAEGSGRSKRIAEQQAASTMLVEQKVWSQHEVLI